MELWNSPLFFMNKFKNRKTKRAVEHSPFLKKIAACQSVCVCVWNSKTKWVRETPKKISKLNNKTSYLNLNNYWTYLSWVWSRCFLSLWCLLWLTLFEYSFTIDASSSIYFWCEDEILEMMKKKYFFLKFFSFISELLNYCDFEKNVYNVQHRIFTQ